MARRALLLLVLAALHGASAAQTDPAQVPGLVFWVRADAGVITDGNGKVSDWLDQSPAGNHCTSPVAASRPVIANNGPGGQPVMLFDGVNDYFSFPAISTIRSVFWVIRENPGLDPYSPRRSLLGNSSSYTFLRGEFQKLWDGSANPFVTGGATRLNFTGINGVTTPLPSNQYVIVSLVTTGNVTASHLTMDLQVESRNWSGQIAEILIYEEALSAEHVVAVENYLADRYSPSFEGIADVSVPYGFCPLEVCAPEGFDAYAWSDGSTGTCVEITQGGSYWVEVTDAFGRTEIDTFSVSYPGILDLPDTTLCAGELFLWNTGLDDAYTFDWAGESGGALLSVSEDLVGPFTVTDSLGCSFTSSLSVQFDAFPLTDLLPVSAELCAGNSLILPALPENAEVTWSNGSSEASLIITESGEYSVSVTNALGCTADDTTTVTITGVAPQIGFEWTTPCAGTPFELAASGDTGEVLGWNWSIGGIDAGDGAIIQYTPTEAGMLSVTLDAEAINGCDAWSSQTIDILAPPVANFQYGPLCAGNEITFLSTTPGDITNWQWTIGESTYTGSVVSHAFPQPGAAQVILVVTASSGCSDEASVPLVILPSPTADPDIALPCHGQLTQFAANMDPNGSGSIASSYWYFGDGTGSSLADPVHYYAAPGTYNAQLAVLATNGCLSEIPVQVMIYDPPQVDFVLGNACTGENFALLPILETDPGDPVQSWNWTVDGIPHSPDPQSTVTFATQGFHIIQLSVMTEAGCPAISSQQVYAWPTPLADFTTTLLTEPDMPTLLFSAANPGTGQQTEWTFGEGIFASGDPVIQAFDSPGTYSVTLVVSIPQGCADTITKDVVVSYPFVDLEVLQCGWREEADGTHWTAVVRNNGNIAVPSVMWKWQPGGEPTFSESMGSPVAPGEVVEYESLTAFAPNELAFPYYCVTVIPVDAPLDDRDATNDRCCSEIGEQGFVLYPPFPNPSPQLFTVRIFTAVTGPLRITVQDASGRIISSLVDEDCPAGYREYLLDASGWAAGSYVVELELGGVRRRQRIIRASID